MKRCPECRRDYYDDSLSYCLDDGSALVDGPASGNEPATAILGERTGSATGHADSDASPRTHPDKHLKMRRFYGNRAAEPTLIGVAILLLLIAGFFGYRFFNSTTSKHISSVAVMPLVNASGDPGLDYLSDGMSESLISSLSHVPGLSVKSSASVFRYKGKNTDPKTLGNDLNVQAIVTGTVAQRGDDLVLHIELVDVATENAMSSTDYQKPVSQLIALQANIARDVSQELQSQLSGTEEKRIAKNYTENAEAYQLYLKGRFYWNKRTADGLRTAIQQFEKAVVADPDYALAYAGLADSYALLAMYGGGVPPTETMPKAKSYALKALELDPDLAEAHASLAQILDNYDYDFAQAEKELRKAIERNPNYPTAHQWLAEVLAHTGRFDESLTEMDRALELDPFSLIVNRMKGLVLFYARRYDDALAQSNRTVALDPSFPGVYYDLFLIDLMKADRDKAIDAYAKWRDLSGDTEGGDRARSSYAKGGWRGFLVDVTNMRGVYRRAYPVRVAWFYVELGDHDAAMDQLKAAYDLRVNDVTWLKAEPQLDPLRGDPRFQELLKTVGFPN